MIFDQFSMEKSVLDALLSNLDLIFFHSAFSLVNNWKSGTKFLFLEVSQANCYPGPDACQKIP